MTKSLEKIFGKTGFPQGVGLNNGPPSAEFVSFPTSETIEKLKSELAKANKRADEAEHRANQDPLTGLKNRLGFEESLKDKVKDFIRNPNKLLVVVNMDFDGLKAINDCHGHPMGDLLIKNMADRFLSCFRASDTIAHVTDSTIARVGGDEFLMIASPNDTKGLAKYIKRVRALQRDLDESTSHKPADHSRISVGFSILNGRVLERIKKELAAEENNSHPTDLCEKICDYLNKTADSRMYRNKIKRRSVGHSNEQGHPVAVLTLGA